MAPAEGRSVMERWTFLDVANLLSVVLAVCAAYAVMAGCTAALMARRRDAAPPEPGASGPVEPAPEEPCDDGPGACAVAGADDEQASECAWVPERGRMRASVRVRSPENGRYLRLLTDEGGDANW